MAPRSLFLVAALIVPFPGLAADRTPGRVTILYDAFGNNPAMTKDWGFSALLEYEGRRVLFDTGNNAEVFAQNVTAAGADLKRLDFVVISHRHLDHTAGLSYLVRLNPEVKIFVPQEVLGGVFGTSAPSSFYRKEAALPEHMRYFDARPPERIILGTPWLGAKFEPIDKTQEVAPGMLLISTVSETPGTKEMRELSLAVRTPDGLILIVGCSHPGIEQIVEAARALDERVRVVFGGFHLPAAKDEDISRIATKLHDVYGWKGWPPGIARGNRPSPCSRRLGVKPTYMREWGA